MSDSSRQTKKGYIISGWTKRRGFWDRLKNVFYPRGDFFGFVLFTKPNVITWKRRNVLYCDIIPCDESILQNNSSHTNKTEIEK